MLRSHACSDGLIRGKTAEQTMHAVADDAVMQPPPFLVSALPGINFHSLSLRFRCRTMWSR